MTESPPVPAVEAAAIEPWAAEGKWVLLVNARQGEEELLLMRTEEGARFVVSEHDRLAAAVGEVSRLEAVNAELREFRAEYLRMTDALSYGDGVTEPAPSPTDLIDPLQAALSVARDHDDGCPEWCDDCEQWERPRSCEKCRGCGCDPATALGAYSPCKDCDGDGRSHVEFARRAGPQVAPDASWIKMDILEERKSYKDVRDA